MISKIVNKIKNGAKELDHSISNRPWKSLWSIPKIMYGTAKYLIYHPTHFTIKGLPYAAHLEQTWKQDIRPKIPLGNPDVYFDVKANKTTSKDYGTGFDPIMKKKDHDEDIRVKVPRYKLPQRSIQQFEAWLESSEEDKKNENFVPKSSDKKKLSNDEQKAYNQLIELYEFLKEKNGTITVEGGELIIKIDVAEKTLEQIEKQVKQCCNSLGLPDDTKMTRTIAKRLYKKARDHGISSDEQFAKKGQQQTSSGPYSASPPQNREENIGGETIEEATAEMEQQAVSKNLTSTLTQQDSNLNNTGDVGFLEQIPNIKKEEQMNSNTQNNDQFSLTNPREFPNDVVRSQLEKNSNELQSDLISRGQFSSQVESASGVSMVSEVKEIVDKGLLNLSLDKAKNLSVKPPYCSGVSRSRGEEVSRG